MAIILMLALAGCLGKDKALQPTETSAQAAQHVDALWDEAIAQLPSGVAAERDVTLDSVPCDAPTDGGPAGRIFVERRAQLVAPASGAWSVTEALPILSEFWLQNDYKVITDDNRIGDLYRFGVQAADGYRLLLRTFDRGERYDVYLTVSSPCVWEFGTPDPQ